MYYVAWLPSPIKAAVFHVCSSIKVSPHYDLYCKIRHRTAHAIKLTFAARTYPVSYAVYLRYSV